MKFNIGDFYENLQTETKFVENWAKTSGTMLEDLSMFCCCHSIAIKRALLE
jgi:hypothetical protein